MKQSFRFKFSPLLCKELSHIKPIIHDHTVYEGTLAKVYWRRQSGLHMTLVFLTGEHLSGAKPLRDTLNLLTKA